MHQKYIERYHKRKILREKGEKMGSEETGARSLALNPKIVCTLTVIKIKIKFFFWLNTQ